LWRGLGCLCAIAVAGFLLENLTNAPRGQIEFFLQTGLRAATPLILAALGELLAEKAGLINIGLEGMILAGAFFAFAAVTSTGSIPLGLAAAILAGVGLALLFGLLCIALRNDQIVTGAALNFLSLGVTGLFYRMFYGTTGSALIVENLPTWSMAGLEGIPYAGPFLFGQTALTYLAVVSALVLVSLFRWTRMGFHLEAVGEHPRAADSAGIPVNRVRWAAILIEGMLCGLAGACLVLVNSNTFNEGMSNGRGFIALAIVIFGRWKPLAIMAAAFFFGAAESLQFLLQATEVPWLRDNYPYLQMLPYLLTLIALAAALGNARPPAALGRHYHRE